MTPDRAHDYESPAEERLAGHLGSLRADPPSPSRDLVKHVVRTARWQRAVTVPLRAVGHILAAAAQGFAVLVGRGRRSAR